MGDGTSVCHELLFGAAKLGMAVSVASPRGYEPKAAIVRLASRDAHEAHGRPRWWATTRARPSAGPRP